MSRLSFLIYSCTLLPYVFGWTAAIHSEIAWRAFNQATPNARRFLKHHLGSDIWGIAKAASWADSDDAKTRYPNSEDYHFSHTPYKSCTKFDLKRDCGFGGSGRCLVTGIADMIMRAVNPALPLPDRQDAIKFVLHLVADIHQPLHTGFARDAGGVDLIVSMEPEMSLHQLWDFGLLSDFIEEEIETPHIKLPEKISDLASMVQYASALATESSTGYTCKHAYMNEGRAYIVYGEALSEEYMRSRALIAQQRIAHASSRLALLLDVMASTFFDAKGKLAAAAASSNPKQKTGGNIPVSNFFAVLEMDFSPSEVAGICEESLEVFRAPDSAPTPKIPRTDLSEIDLLEDALAEAARERATAQMMASPAIYNSSSVSGVDFDSIVLIRRDISLFLTRKEFVIADPNYRAVSIIPYSVRFVFRKRSQFIEFGVDTELFGWKSISQTDFARVLLYLKHGYDVPESAIRGLVHGPPAAVDTSAVAVSPIKSVKTLREDPSMLSRVFGRRVENGYVASFPRSNKEDELSMRWIEAAGRKIIEQTVDWARNKTRFPTVEDKLNYDFFTKFRSIVMYNSGNIQGYFLKESILDRNVTHRRFNMFLVKNSGLVGSDQFFIIMDTEIFDGMITPKIQKGMYAVDGRKSEDSNPVTSSAPTLEMEMRDLNRVLNKGSGRRLHIIQDLVQYPSPLGGDMIKVIEYEIKPQKDLDDDS